MKKLLSAVFLTALSVSLPTQAAKVNTATTTVKEIFSYSTIDNGSTIFTVNNPISTCAGFWLDAADPGFRSNLSVLLSAYQVSSPIIAYGESSQLFSGSSAKYCKLTTIRLRPQ